MAFRFASEAVLSAGVIKISGKGKGQNDASLPPEISLSDVILARKLFPSLGNGHSARRIRALVAPGASAPGSFIVSVDREWLESKKEAAQDAGGVFYLLKREFGDSFALTGEGIRHILEILGEAEGMFFISSLILPVSLVPAFRGGKRK